MKYLTFILFLMVFSCSSSDDIALIPKNDFTKIHGEVLVLEAYYQNKYRSAGIYKDSLKQSVTDLIKKKGYTFEQYEKTYDYYAVRQKDFQEINSELIESFSNKKL
ncbi:MAG: DUF4296 domain-containing protein [Crocinitomicaceae bacterium]|jgi:hypothetical protein|nr:DUF4296 domain-containing protein [Crocinitomicaceae bacterium]